MMENLTMIKSKSTQLSRCNFDFLVTLAEKTNLSYRYHKSRNISSLLQLLSNKFNSETIDWIVKMYLLCRDAEDVAKSLIPNGMDDIVKTIPDFFGTGDFFYEVLLGKRICDVIIVKDKEVIAIEVKSVSDDISRAVNQTKCYSLCANRTYLAYDSKHRQRVKRLFKQQAKIGLLEYSNGVIKLHREASLNSLDLHTLLSFTSYKYIRKLARNLDIDARGTKTEISNRLAQILSNVEIQQSFIEFLRGKAVIKDRATKRFDGTELSYPLKRFLGG